MNDFKCFDETLPDILLMQILRSKFHVQIVGNNGSSFWVKKDNLILYFKDARGYYRFYEELIMRADNVNILNFFLIVSRSLSFYDSHLIQCTYYKFLNKSEIEYLGSFNWTTFEIITPSPQNDMKLLFGYKKYNIDFKFLISDNDNKLKKIKLFEGALRKYGS